MVIFYILPLAVAGFLFIVSIPAHVRRKGGVFGGANLLNGYLAYLEKCRELGEKGDVQAAQLHRWFRLALVASVVGFVLFCLFASSSN